MSLNVITDPKQSQSTSVLSIFQHASCWMFLNQMIVWLIRVSSYPLCQVKAASIIEPPSWRHMCSQTMDYHYLTPPGLSFHSITFLNLLTTSEMWQISQLSMDCHIIGLHHQEQSFNWTCRYKLTPSFNF